MKFKILGDLDAPDWLLKEMATLARMVHSTPPSSCP